MKYLLISVIAIIIYLTYCYCNKPKIEGLKIRFRESDVQEFADLLKNYLTTRSELVLNQQKNINNAVKVNNADVNNVKTKERLIEVSKDYKNSIDENEVKDLLNDEKMPLKNDEFLLVKTTLENIIKNSNETSNMELFDKLSQYKKMIDEKYSKLSENVQYKLKGKIDKMNEQLNVLNESVEKSPMDKDYKPQSSKEKENLEEAKLLMNDSVMNNYDIGKYEMMDRSTVINEALLKDVYNIREMMSEENCAKACISDKTMEQFGYTCNGFLYNVDKNQNNNYECKLYENTKLNPELTMPNGIKSYRLNREKLKTSKDVLNEIKEMILKNTTVLNSILEGRKNSMMEKVETTKLENEQMNKMYVMVLLHNSNFLHFANIRFLDSKEQNIKITDARLVNDVPFVFNDSSLGVQYSCDGNPNTMVHSSKSNNGMYVIYELESSSELKKMNLINRNDNSMERIYGQKIIILDSNLYALKQKVIQESESEDGINFMYDISQFSDFVYEDNLQDVFYQTKVLKFENNDTSKIYQMLNNVEKTQCITDEN